jgi:hypothetical protein
MSRGLRQVEPDDLSRVEATAVLAIAAYRVQHGRGPAWSLLFRALGWSSAEGKRRLSALERGGLVTFTPEPGSLDVPPPAARAALRKVRSDRHH